MSFETLLYDVEDRVATITLNRPERRNAFDWTMAGELTQAWEEVKRDPDVSCVILTGAGDQALCTGVDVQAVVGSPVFEELRRSAPIPNLEAGIAAIEQWTGINPMRDIEAIVFCGELTLYY